MKTKRGAAILVDHLAAVDSLFRPFRSWGRGHGDSATAIYAARKVYLDRGLAWVSNGSSEAARKSAQRELEELITAGHFHASRSQGRTTHVKLSDAGEVFARSMTASYLHTECKSLFDDIMRLQYESEHYTNRFALWVPETRLCGVDWGDPNATTGENLMGALQMRLISLLVRGWLESHSSVQGHTWYRTTLEGVEAAYERPEAWTLPPTLPEFDENAAAFYDNQFKRHLQRWHRAKSETANDCGPIPFPVSFARTAGTGHVDGNFPAELIEGAING